MTTIANYGRFSDFPQHFHREERKRRVFQGEGLAQTKTLAILALVV
jgi:hypothetical protein